MGEAAANHGIDARVHISDSVVEFAGGQGDAELVTEAEKWRAHVRALAGHPALDELRRKAPQCAREYDLAFGDTAKVCGLGLAGWRGLWLVLSAMHAQVATAVQHAIAAKMPMRVLAGLCEVAGVDLVQAMGSALRQALGDVAWDELDTVLSLCSGDEAMRGMTESVLETATSDTGNDLKTRLKILAMAAEVWLQSAACSVSYCF